MSTENGTRVATIIGILIGGAVLVAAGLVAVLRLDHVRDAQERAALEHEHRQMVEEHVRRERQLRADAQLARLGEENGRAIMEARIAPMPREKPTDPAVLEQQKRDAHRHCQNLAQAAEAFNLNAANESGYPRTLKELVMPPFGGPSFLRNGERDLIDPWGNPYQLEPFQRADGTEVPLVLCFGPDKVPISQFGIGDKARPLK